MQLLLERDSLAPELQQIVTVGLHHEQQHQELLLTDLKHLFSAIRCCRRMRRRSIPPRAAAHVPLAFLDSRAGWRRSAMPAKASVSTTSSRRHRVFLEPFRLANRLATNGEYLQFIREGGYRAPRALALGRLGMRAARAVAQPLYWAESLDRNSRSRGKRALDPHAPVCHLSYYEADAFARWAGARLPTEFEWEHAASSVALQGNFVEDGLWHPPHATPAVRRIRAPACRCSATCGSGRLPPMHPTRGFSR